MPYLTDLYEFMLSRLENERYTPLFQTIYKDFNADANTLRRELSALNNPFYSETKRQAFNRVLNYLNNMHGINKNTIQNRRMYKDDRHLLDAYDHCRLEIKINY